MITAHQLYLSLGKDKSSRNVAYRHLFADPMVDNHIEEIRAAWQTGTPLANDRVKAQIEETLNAKVGYARWGQPKGEFSIHQLIFLG